MRWALLISLSLICAWPQNPTRWTPEFSMQIQNIGTVVPSPDGSLVAWTQIQMVMEAERSEQVSQIYLARPDGSGRIQLTRHEKGATAPSFSPDGRWIYFLSARSGKQSEKSSESDEPKHNVYRIPIGGGEPEMLTEWKGGIAAFQLSPDGKQIAIVATGETGDEKRKKEKLDFRVIDEKPPYARLAVIPAEPDAAAKRPWRQLVSAPLHVTAIDWSPDSRHIAYSHQPDPGADDWTKADISELDVERGTTAALAATPAAETNPRYSPDGRYLAFQKSEEPPQWQQSTRIALMARGTRAVRLLNATYDELPVLLGWAADSRRLFLQERKHTRHVIYAMPLDGAAEPLLEPAKGAIGPGAVLAAKGSHLGLPLEAADEAPEAYVLRIGDRAPVRVSRANLDLPKLPFGETKVIRWKAKDGSEIEGLLTYPREYRDGSKVPLILNIHGGPAGVFSETFIGRATVYPLAALAARGFAILRPNPRGSGAYGHKFRTANLNDWGGKDYEDIMAGVDHMIALGVADPERMAVMGWSYGGFMTSWVTTQTRRFKAAAVGAGVTNLWSFTGTADIPSFLPSYFGGDPWDVFENYRKHSPMSFVKNVRTPTLILHGEADVRVPVSQGYEWYNALKRQGVPAKMVVYPRTPHGPTEPKFILDMATRHMEWIEKHL